MSETSINIFLNQSLHVLFCDYFFLLQERVGVYGVEIDMELRRRAKTNNLHPTSAQMVEMESESDRRTSHGLVSNV